MGKVEIFVRETRPGDADLLAADMRDDDRRECLATILADPTESIERSISTSEYAWTGFAGGRIAFIGGVTARQFYSEKRIPWLLGTPAIDDNPASFLRFCRRSWPGIRERFPVLENHVDARNAKTVRWLRWLGFDIHEPQPWGILRRPFHRFTLGIDDVHAGSGTGIRAAGGGCPGDGGHPAG